MEYEISSDPFDPRSIYACSTFLEGEQPEEANLLMERIRGKKEDMFHYFSLDEEYDHINQQIVESQGFDVDFSMYRYLFYFFPALIDDSDVPEMATDYFGRMDRDYFGRLAKEAIELYNKKQGKSFEFVNVEKANIYSNSGLVYFITFRVKGLYEDKHTIIFQAKVINEFCREIVHSFCRPKPNQEVEYNEDPKKFAKKQGLNIKKLG